MFNPLALISGSAGPWIVLGAFLIGLAGGGTGAYVARGIIDAPALSKEQAATAQASQATAECRASHEAARADGSEKAITALNQAAGDATSAMNNLAAKASLRAAEDTKFAKDLANAPITSVCGGSAAELAYRRSVQQHAAGATSAP